MFLIVEGLFNIQKPYMNVNNLYWITIGTNTYDILIHKKNCTKRGKLCKNKTELGSQCVYTT